MPVAGKTASEISTRAEYFRKMIDLQCRSPAMRDLGLVYHPNAADVLSHIYFGLSEAYKAEYLYPDRRTDPTKQAAITCAAIAVVKPLRPPSAEIEREEFLYVNQMFAMRCSCSIIEHSFHTQAFDARRRVYKQLSLIEFPCTKEAMTEAANNNGQIKSELVFDLSSTEDYKLKSLMNLFVVLNDLQHCLPGHLH
jgi:hypothetical protein